MLKKIIVGCFMLQMINAAEFSVWTQNILGPNTQDVEGFGYTKNDYRRLENVIAKGLQIQPTFLCFQEWDGQTWSKLSKSIQDSIKQDYELVAYQPKGQNGGVVLYQKRDPKIVVVLKNSLALPSSNPKFPGACAYGVFDINGNKVLVASLHISRANYRSGKNDGIQQLNDLVNDLKNLIVQQKCSVVLTGDLNTFYEEVANDTIQYLAGQGLPVAMYEHGSWTVNDKDGNFAAIDHVLYSPNLKLDVKKSWVGSSAMSYADQQALSAQAKIKAPMPLIHKSGYNSDHLPIFVTFDIVNGGNGAQPAPQKEPQKVHEKAKEVDFAEWFANNEPWIVQNMNMIVRSELDMGFGLGDDLLTWVPQVPQDLLQQWEHQLRAKLEDLLEKRKDEIRAAAHKKDFAIVDPSLAMQALELAICLKK